MMFANIKAYSAPRAAIRGVVGTRLLAQLGVRVVRRVLQLVQSLEQRRSGVLAAHKKKQATAKAAKEEAPAAR